jgi:hypothetical protein
MARSKTNKSAAIRDALKANPSKGPKEIAEMLAKEGVKVSAMYVSNIKAAAAKRKGKTAGKNGRGRFAIDAVENTVSFVKDVGGIEQAKQLIALLEKVRGA